MDNQESETRDEGLERATAARLAKLRSRPVDTSRLERMIEAQIPRTHAQPAIRLWKWLRPSRAIAASLLIFAMIGAVLIATWGGPAMASPAEMARLHDDIVSGRTAVTRVDTIAAANKMLAAQWGASPQIPNIPAEYTMACCMRSVKNKKVACVLLEDNGGPVTMTVAKASDMRSPTSPTVIRGGVTYHVQAVGRLNMVMTERNDRWICLIGQVSSDRLMDLAGQLQF
ncbi:MAG: hypothetical protein ABSH08_06385 [Tepidisphaeraceae bacterium]|jgi:hypothetical protein